MKRPVEILSLLLLLLALGVLGCAASISYQRMSAVDLPEGVFKVTVYRSSSGAPAVILDNPNDDILVKPGKDWFRFKEQGMQSTEKYLTDPGWMPDVFGLKHIESGKVACYLLLSPELRWLFSYNKRTSEITITIEDPHELAKGGA